MPENHKDLAVAAACLLNVRHLVEKGIVE